MQKSETIRMNVIHRLPPVCAFQNLIFHEFSTEKLAPCLLVTFCFDPCALELTQLRDWEMLLITTAAHINHEILMIIYNYKLFDYIQMKNA